MNPACKFYLETFAQCFTNLRTAAEAVCELSMQQAVNEEKGLASKEENSERNLTLSSNGIWKKSGHISSF